MLVAASVPPIMSKLNLVKEAFAEVQKGSLHLIWLQGAGCTGCSIALLNTTYPDIVDVVSGVFPGAGTVSIDFHPTIMADWGEDAVEALRKAEEGALDPFVLVVEGSVQSESLAGEGFWCMISERNGQIETMENWLKRLAPRAIATVAVGSCAAYGGIPAARGNVTGAKGCWDILGRDWVSSAGLPVINVPGCPPHGDWIIDVLAHLILTYKGLLSPPVLDEFNRPTYIYKYLAHEHCPRATFFAESVFSKEFGEPYCMFELGCKGPLARCDVPERGWINGIGGCPNSGGPCIGCTEPDFPDRFEPFTQPKLPKPKLPGRLEPLTPIPKYEEKYSTAGNGLPVLSSAAIATAAIAAALGGLYIRKKKTSEGKA